MAITAACRASLTQSTLPHRTQQPEETLRLILQQLAAYPDFHFRRKKRMQPTQGNSHCGEHELSYQKLREYRKVFCAEFKLQSVRHALRGPPIPGTS
jgi:hypothetical protein